MHIKNEKPPNWDKIIKFFDVEGKDVVFAYGDTIYCPKGGEVPEHLMVHETVHSKQQGDDPEGWWDRYIEDKEFRLEQEVQAYATQYTYIKRLYRTKISDGFLDEVALDLSSDIYGNIVDFQKAHTLIRRFAQNMV